MFRYINRVLDSIAEWAGEIHPVLAVIVAIDASYRLEWFELHLPIVRLLLEGGH
jgi:hypothetical protein